MSTVLDIWSEVFIYRVLLRKEHSSPTLSWLTEVKLVFFFLLTVKCSFLLKGYAWFIGWIMSLNSLVPGWWQFRWLLPDALCTLMRPDCVTQQDLQGEGQWIAWGRGRAGKSFLPWAFHVLSRLEGSVLTFKKSVSFSKKSEKSYQCFYLDTL